MRVYTFHPAGWDRFDPREGHPPSGARVVKVQPSGCPQNGTMDHCFVADADTGYFYGLVSEASLALARDPALGVDEADICDRY